MWWVVSGWLVADKMTKKFFRHLSLLACLYNVNFTGGALTTKNKLLLLFALPSERDLANHLPTE